MPQGRNSGSLLEFSFTSKVAAGLPVAALLRLSQRVWSANTRLGLTGQLHHADGAFQQIVEGPTGAMLSLIPAILADPRHESITIQSLRHVEKRAYSGWLTTGFGAGGASSSRGSAHWMPRLATEAIRDAIDMPVTRGVSLK